MVIASNLVSMLIENDAHPDKPQQDEPHQQAGHYTGKIDPDIGDLAAAARHKELDGLIGQGCEQAAQHGPGHMLEEVPGVHPQAEHEQEAFQQILAEMRQLAHDVHGEPVSGTGKAQMPQDTLQYRYLLGGNLLIDMEEKHPVQEISIDEPLSVLKEALKTGQEDLALQTLVSIEDLIRNALMQKSRACMYLQQVIRTMDNACEDVSADMEQIREGRDELIREITDQKFFGEACEVVARHTKRVISILSAMNTSSSERQARLAIDYIQKNYMVPDLSLNSICSYLNISTSYFSTIFKEETGETFTEVLIRTRMEKAKELLENTTMKNYEIAEKVGFSDPHYFGISFKKMTGYTPTEYAREKRR